MFGSNREWLEDEQLQHTLEGGNVVTTRMDLGGNFMLPGSSIALNRMGYGAMQLAGPQVWGPPRDQMGRLLFCERRLRSASIISIPATITARMLRIRSLSRPFILILMTW